MQNELLKEARIIVEERRSSVVLGIKGEPHREGVFQWVEGPPTAGNPAVLAYNANSGALRNAQVTINDHMQTGFYLTHTHACTDAGMHARPHWKEQQAPGFGTACQKHMSCVVHLCDCD